MIVSSQELVLVLLRHKMARITLNITTQSILYTDARWGIMQEHSGGLVNRKFFFQRRNIFSTQQKYRLNFSSIDKNIFVPDICDNLSGFHEANN